MCRLRVRLLAALLALGALPIAPAARAQDRLDSGANWGGVGLLETRNARMRPDGALEAGLAYRRQRTFWFLNFQALPFLETTFRFTQRLDGRSGNQDSTDRAFDIKLRLLQESEWIPAFAIGLQDFVGTGIYSGEYIVASKRWADFDFSLGYGWGRVGSNDMLTNPLVYVSESFRTRPVDVGQGGRPSDVYFRGEDTSLFGGVEWRPLASRGADSVWSGLRLKLEYNGDRYRDERPNGRGDARSQVNFGVQWTPYHWLDAGAAFVNGTDLLLRVSFILDPTRPRSSPPPPPPMPPRPWLPAEQPAYGTRAAESATAPRIVVPSGVREVIAASGPLTPVVPVPTSAPAAPDGSPAPPAIDFADPRVRAALADAIAVRLRQAGMIASRIDPSEPLATIVLARSPFRTLAQTAARAIRAAQTALPPRTELVTVVLLEGGAEVGRLTLVRREIEKLQSGQSSAEEIAATAMVGAAGAPLPADAVPIAGTWPQFSWAIEPLLMAQVMDPDQAFRYTALATASGRVAFNGGWSFGGTIGAQIVGNIATPTPSDSTLPHVRSDIGRYLEEAKVPILSLTAQRIWTPAPDIFARVTAGYLELMYAGLSSEVLWRPANRSYAFGIDVNAVAQRDYNGGFGTLGYSVITGHASWYQDLGVLGLTGIVRAGRYLAGDWGATFELVRKFPSGIEVGGFFTLTTVPFSRYGEGSFDKGIFVRVPFDLFPGESTRSSAQATLRPLTRDGGARLAVESPLYQLTEPGRRDALEREFYQLAR
ncbi:MAG: YjbH domain-containing protein [Acetobacteraceae bacterium]|nr:YjbH domain-containing protein [Acetobacteraceae bacterium]